MSINGSKKEGISSKPVKRWGIYNTRAKEFQFGICETSKTKAEKKLFQKIGRDAYKWRFVIKELKFGNPKAEVLLKRFM